MRNLVTLLVLVLVALPVLAQAPTPVCAGTKEECQRLISLLRLRDKRDAEIQALVLRFQKEIADEGAALEHDVRVRLGAKPDDAIDMATLTIKPKLSEAK